jgi:hypothetical protein
MGISSGSVAVDVQIARFTADGFRVQRSHLVRHAPDGIASNLVRRRKSRTCDMYTPFFL